MDILIIRCVKRFFNCCIKFLSMWLDIERSHCQEDKGHEIVLIKVHHYIEMIDHCVLVIGTSSFMPQQQQ